MPAVWGEEDFQSGGLKGIMRFTGILDELEEDIEGEYNTQIALYFSEVEVEESVDDVSLEDGKYTDWIKQSNRKGSVNEQFARHLREFIRDHKLKGGVPDGIYGQRIVWERQEVLEGNPEKNLSPGMCLVPVALAEEKPKRRKAASKTEPARKPEPEDDEKGIPQELMDFIVSVVGEDGATRDLIRRDVTKKGPMRKVMTAAGGLDVVLAHMVAEALLTEDDGTYFPEE